MTFFDPAKLMAKNRNVLAKKLAERFIEPPFTVLDARQGRWQERKKIWLSLGIRSELGRGDVMFCGDSSVYSGTTDWSRTRTTPKAAPEVAEPENDPKGTPNPPNAAEASPRKKKGGYAKTYNTGKPGDLQKAMKAKCSGQTWNAYGQTDETSQKIAAAQPHSGTSIFDPVVCELMYKWFCKPGGHILDPFAGGSVRGIVASVLGYSYTGIDLRPEQCRSNFHQCETILPNGGWPAWLTGDSIKVLGELDYGYDFVFSCPPYADLERYSDDPRDLSTMDFHGFLVAYRNIIAKSCTLLRNNRFAAFVVGDIRDPKCKNGGYRNLPAHTIKAFEKAGLVYYNRAVLITAIGSMGLRAKQFATSRKLVSGHQEVLVFLKGDYKKAVKRMGESHETV